MIDSDICPIFRWNANFQLFSSPRGIWLLESNLKCGISLRFSGDSFDCFCTPGLPTFDRRCSIGKDARCAGMSMEGSHSATSDLKLKLKLKLKVQVHAMPPCPQPPCLVVTPSTMQVMGYLGFDMCASVQKIASKIPYLTYQNAVLGDDCICARHCVACVLIKYELTQWKLVLATMGPIFGTVWAVNWLLDHLYCSCPVCDPQSHLYTIG